MIPEYFDKDCMVYQQDAVLFLNALRSESVQLIWTDPPIGSHDRSTPHKDFSQMEAVELCAAMADAAFRVLTPSGMIAIVLDNQNSEGVMPAIAKRTHLQFGGFFWDSSDMDSTIIVFHKGDPKFNDAPLTREVGDQVETISVFIEDHTDPGDFVVDPFCGPGAVMEAAVTAGRVALVNDHDPEAVAATVARYRSIS